jgi:hypothetical protein
MPAHAGGVTAPARPPTLLRRVLVVALAVQAAILLNQFTVFFAEMFRFPSTLGQPLTGALGTSLALLLWILVSARLWSGPGLEHFAASALAHVATLGLCHYAVGLVAGRLFPPVTAVFLSVSLTAGAGAALRRRGRAPRRNPESPPTAWDTGSAVVLATLLIPTVFAYIHYDTKTIWACRAFALRAAPSLAAFATCDCPAYPPVWSLLLWLGIEDPVFQGRLLAWLLLPLFALFFRARLARADAPMAPPALLFTLVTVQVWQGAAMYYANVPLMIFLVTGSLLVLGVPREPGGSGISAGELLAGSVCLCAAVLVRPDGLYYLAVVAASAAWMRIRRRMASPLWPFLLAGAAAASWAFRPGLPGSFFTRSTGEWRTAGVTTVRAMASVFGTFLNGWQGQWLSHKGFGVVFYLLAFLAIWRWRGGDAGGRSEETRFLGLVSLGFLLAVMVCYAAMPFFGDIRTACPPGETRYLACYLSFVRVGLGRMTVHLYPMLVLWGVMAVRDAGRSAVANRALEREAPANMACLRGGSTRRGK